MTRFSISHSLRLGLIWGAVLMLLCAARFESDYCYRLNQLPTLVDAHGNTASLETAMSGLDSYERANRVRSFGFVSLGLGVLFCACAVITKSQRKEPYGA